MTGSQKVLLSGGLVLAILGMSYGFWFAVFDEHPTLEYMGLSLATAFAEVAAGNMEQAREALQAYDETRHEYVREVHTHGHVVALATLLLLLGLFFNQVAYSERARLVLASLLVFGTAALPAGSWLEIVLTGPFPTVLAVLGTAAIIGSLAAVAAGWIRAAKTDSGG